MTRRAYTAVLTSIGFFGLALSFIGLVHTSTGWLLASLPAQEDFLVYDRRQGRQLEPILAQMPEALKKRSGYSAAAAYLPLISKLAITLKADEETIVILPTWRGQALLRNELTRDGWQVKRMGLVLAARRGGAPGLPEWDEVLRRLLPARQGLAARWAPLMAGRVQKGRWVIDRRGGGIDVLAAAGERPASAGPADTTTPAPDEVFLYLPSHYWRALPPELLKAWDEQIAAGVGFAKTKPAVSSDLVKLEDVFIQTKNEEFLIGGRGDTDAWRTAVEGWLIEEERRGRIVTQGFRLPDGTFGFEKVPGEPLRGVLRKQGPGECWQSTLSEYPWRLCAESGKAVLSTQPEQMPIHFDWGAEGTLRLGKDFLSPLGIADAVSLSAQITEDTAQARVELE